MCVSESVCLCMQGDKVKGFTLHLSLCMYPFWDPLCKEEASFHSFSHSNASYTLCETPLNVEKIG